MQTEGEIQIAEQGQNADFVFVLVSFFFVKLYLVLTTYVSPSVITSSGISLN